jgi:uncharacterized protein
MRKEEYLGFFDALANKKYSRLGTTFETKDSKYFYDAGTGKVFECSPHEYLVIKEMLTSNGMSSLDKTGLSENEILNVLEQLKNMADSENVFQLPVYETFITKARANDETEKEVQQVILELTEQCNLRCKYCVYTESLDKFRAFSATDMSWDVAKKAMDYVSEYGGEEVSITFYGGEPLLKYDLMKECIEYARQIMGGKKKLSFGITTNLTLLNQEMCDYIVSLDSCAITVSIDGPKEIHNANRVTVNNKGSFDKAIAGLKLLVEAMGAEKAKKLMGINAVFMPPYSIEKILEIKNFFKSLTWLPKDIIIRLTYVDSADSKLYSEMDMDSFSRFFDKPMKETDPISYLNMEEICSNTNDGMGRTGDNVNLLMIHNRIISEQPIPFLKQNGCCTPGSRRLYVTTQGKFKVCERIGNSPDIGDTEHGIDHDAIKKHYVVDYADHSIDKCNECWAANLCSLCFAAVYNEDGIDIEMKDRVCHAQKARVKNSLTMYHQIMESNPEFIKKIVSDTLK